ncbi:uncharacterized protein BX663DRAFT_333705 [Cokeromyces recurvatus]|uniref:uncharacterized protein n=1 Tax=Cokeromyces recurvatus TaxID=90255 RepID=UPI00221F87D8|nr:uncharacterized protein BX663DRAFT_333705 [Cokeromyces recurvatus]KAI7904172.1 hypothetical protein BX663DRAFT_333705 [Cokeromyces recurvatus]
MESYLANIDAYMQQKQREEEEQQNQQNNNNLNDSTNLTSSIDDIWLNYIPTSNITTTEQPTFYSSMYMNSPYYTDNTNMNSALPTNVTMTQTSSPVSTNFNLSPPPLSSPPQQQQQQQQPIIGPDGQPIRIRKKPGRKPNPTSPALRKAQNRAAQRAFRERKERHIRELELTIRQLRDQRVSLTRELKSVKKSLEIYNIENWYLKGLVLTLQFICMHHNIQIPEHMPYLRTEALHKIGVESPHAIEAYINTYTKNDTNLKSTNTNTNTTTTTNTNANTNTTTTTTTEAETKTDIEAATTKPSVIHQDNNNTTILASESNIKQVLPVSSQEAIQYIRLHMSTQAALPHTSIHDHGLSHLNPTTLQLAIPDHDPRIDFIPAPHMRDRMILFRNQIDYDRCFNMLINGAVYHGGDPTKAESWELPTEFFNEFWYLTLDYDIRKTNKWRRLKGLKDLTPRLQNRIINNNCQDFNGSLRRQDSSQSLESIVDLMSSL